MINGVAIPNDVPPNLVKAIMLFESGGDAFFISPEGRCGLMQLHESVVWPRPRPKRGTYHVGMKPTYQDRDVMNPRVNVEIACSDYLAPALATFDNDLEAVIACYTVGGNAVKLAIRRGQSPISVTAAPWYVPLVRSSFLSFQGRSPK